mgnify:CR=1 FL=1|tara:strand:+ start:228 stop:368 length:141 start_codon:yes stop_codon:yes gene_type:complete
MKLKNKQYCECKYPEINNKLYESTKHKLTRYKCKKCDGIWINTFGT